MNEPRVLYAGWDFGAAMSAGEKSHATFRLIQFELNGGWMRIVLASPGDGRICPQRVIQIEERLQVPTGKGGMMDVYVEAEA